jgi:hypothetical protein
MTVFPFPKLAVRFVCGVPEACGQASAAIGVVNLPMPAPAAQPARRIIPGSCAGVLGSRISHESVAPESPRIDISSPDATGRGRR